MQPTKIGRSCDECKARKVRCTKTNESDTVCIHCQRRGAACHFSPYKKRQRRPAPASASPLHDSPEPSPPPFSDRGLNPYSVPSASAATPSSVDVTSYSPAALLLDPQPRTPHDPREKKSKLFMDYLLEDRKLTGRQVHRGDVFKANDHYIASSNIAFFSGGRLASLSRRLGHDRVKSIVDNIESTIHEKITATDLISDCFAASRRAEYPIRESEQLRQAYIKSYFEEVHPVYPFMNRNAFEQQAFGPHFEHYLVNDPAWSALYHAILALGSQYHDGGTFTPGKGKAWKFFQAALSLLPKVLLPKGTLTNAQAVVAMAIFSLNFVGMQIDEFLVTEAARISRALGLQKANSGNGNSQDANRTFWVIYCLEKDYSFDDGKPSSISDYDIGCPIPEVPDSRFGDLDWLLTYARFSRLLNKTYESLFSVSATLNTREEYYQAIDGIRADLEHWKNTLPAEFQPDRSLRAGSKGLPGYTTVALRLRLSYYNVIIVLSRLTLHVGNGEPSERQTESMEALLSSARSILDLTRHIDLEPYTPIWELGTMPIVALFILFDFTVHNPTHPDTRVNLTFLDVAAGHFSRLELASGGAFPSSVLAEFTHIARQHTQAGQAKKRKSPMESSGEEQLQQATPESYQQGVGGTPVPIESMRIPDMFGKMDVPDSLFFNGDFDASMMDPQNMGFDLMGLFGPVMNMAPALQPPDVLQQQQVFNAMSEA